jgi:hypothetical protein
LHLLQDLSKQRRRRKTEVANLFLSLLMRFVRRWIVSFTEYEDEEQETAASDLRQV